MKRFCKILGSLILGVVHFLSHAQNLVPNPSFEDTITSPTPIQILTNALYWINPNTATPDYFNSITSITTADKVPSNARGFQYPKTGTAYGGFFGAGQSVTGGPLLEAEYVQVELMDSLIMEHEYCVKFYISLSNYSTVAITEIGAFFSDAPIWRGDHFYFTDTPQVISISGLFLDDTLNWMEVSGSFIASGGEKYLTIGKFNFEGNIDTINRPITAVPGRFAYYYIDEVSVKECPPIPPIPRPIPPISYPNIFTPNNDGINDKLEFLNLPDSSQIEIFNRWGNVVYQSKNYQNDWTAEGVSDGVYFYLIKLPDGKIEKGTIQLLR